MSLTTKPAIIATIADSSMATISNAWLVAVTTAAGPADAGNCSAPVTRTKA